MLDGPSGVGFSLGQIPEAKGYRMKKYLMTTMFGIVFVGLICISSGCFNAKKQGAINLPDRGMFQFGEHEAFI